MTRLWPALKTAKGVVKTGSPFSGDTILRALAWRANAHTNIVSEKVFNKRRGNNDVKDVNFLFISCWFEVFRISLPGFDVGQCTRTKNWIGSLEESVDLKSSEKKNNRGNGHSEFHHKHNNSFRYSKQSAP